VYLLYLLLRDEVGLIDEDDIGELELVGEEVYDGAFVFLSDGLLAVSERVRSGVVPEEVGRIDDGDHRIDLGDVTE